MEFVRLVDAQLHRGSRAVLEVSDGLLLVRVGDQLLTARFDGERGTFSREASGRGTQFTLDQQGRIVLYGGPEMSGVAEEMDIVAERLAREIMR